MGGGGGKSVDTSAQEADLARQRAEAERLETEASTKEVWAPNARDVRPDGTRKGSGWLGSIPMTDGRVMTEQTAEMTVDGKNISFPLIHPGSTKEELDALSKGRKLPRESYMRALEHALKRKKEGRSPYKDEEE